MKLDLKLNGKYRIGLRAIKTAIAVALCLLLSFVFHRHDALFSSIAAIICMQQTYNETFKSGIHRLIGTILGGVLGYFVLEIIFAIPGYKNWFDILIVPVCILMVIYLCNMMNKQSSVVIGCIVLVSIIAVPEKNVDGTLFYVINRVIDTSIGIVVAMLVNRFLLPKTVQKQQKEE